MKNGNLSLLVTSHKGSWFRSEGSWSESFAEPKNPVSASGMKIVNTPSNDSREPVQIRFLELFGSTEYRSPINRSRITSTSTYLHIVHRNISKGRNAGGRPGTDYLIIFLKVFVSFMSRISGCRLFQSWIVRGQKLYSYASQLVCKGKNFSG